MEIDFKVIFARDLKDGDVFYCNPNAEMNEFGPSAIVSGTDQILIVDDEYSDEIETGNYSVVVNGGYIIWFAPGEKVVLLTHYSKIINVIDMVKVGHPDMNIGPNDANTVISDMMEADPTYRVDLLAGMDIDLTHDGSEDEFDEDEDEDELDDLEDDLEDDEPPKRTDDEDEDFEMPF